MIWVGEWRTKRLRPNETDKWRSILGALENKDATFQGYSLSRCRPIMHPDRPGALALPGGPFTINVVGGDNASFTLSGATGLKLRQGDMLQVRGADLYRVDNSSDSGASVSVTPQLWPGTATTQAVSVLRPWCEMTIVPGSVQTPSSDDGWTVISFQGVEARG